MMLNTECENTLIFTFHIFMLHFLFIFLINTLIYIIDPLSSPIYITEFKQNRIDNIPIHNKQYTNTQ